MFWRNDFRNEVGKSRVFALLIMILGLFFINQINYSAGNSQVKKVKIEYFGRKDCKNCANLEKFLKELATKRDDFEYVEHKIDESKEEKAFGMTIQISISHSREYAVSTVIIYKK